MGCVSSIISKLLEIGKGKSGVKEPQNKNMQCDFVMLGLIVLKMGKCNMSN